MIALKKIKNQAIIVVIEMLEVQTAILIKNNPKSRHKKRNKKEIPQEEGAVIATPIPLIWQGQWLQ